MSCPKDRFWLTFIVEKKCIFRKNTLPANGQRVNIGRLLYGI